jgi:ubiquinone/menaquinone biosynthesis C-methylase UbiE
MSHTVFQNITEADKEFTTDIDIGLFSEFIDKDSIILDYGCGYGRTIDILDTVSYKNIYGVDISNEMIDMSRKKFPAYEFHVIESKDVKLNFEDGFFDAVFLLAVLTCISSDREQNQVLNEISRVLKPNGIIYINDFLLNSDQQNFQRYNKFLPKYKNFGVFEIEDGAVFRHHCDERVKEIRLNFHEMFYEKVIFNTINGNTSNGFVYVGRNK